MEQPGSDIDHYVENLVKILEEKKQQIVGLKKHLDEFKQHLIEEQVLSTHCSERQYDGKDDAQDTQDDTGRTGDLSNKENNTGLFPPYQPHNNTNF